MKNFLNCISEMYFNSPDMKLNQALKDKKIIILFIPYYDEDCAERIMTGIKTLKQWGLEIYAVCMEDDFFEKDVFASEKVIRLSKLNHMKKLNDIVVLMFNFLTLPIQWTMVSALKKNGVENIVFVGNDYATNYREIMDNLYNIYTVYEMFQEDEYSKKVLLAILRARITGNVTDMIFSEIKQYFVPEFKLNENSIIIDGGAYDGMTAYEFLSSMKGIGKIYSFELDKNNYNKFLSNKKHISKDKIIFENLGLGEKQDIVYYNSLTTASRLSNNNNLGEEGKIVDLDTYVGINRIDQIDYIKLDIEGEELNALKGARNIISTCRPKMAISLYHRFNDLWELPVFIKMINPSYKFSLYHHYIDTKMGYDPEGFTIKDKYLQDKYGECGIYKTVFETVLYVY